MGIRGVIAVLLALAMVVGTGAVPVAAKPPPSATTNASQAQSAYNGMQHYFYVSTPSLYRPSYPRQANDPTYSYHWPFSQATAGTIDMFGYSSTYRSAVSARMTGLGRYWDAAATPSGYDSYVLPPYGNGGDKWDDDNAWSGLDLERTYQMTGDANALTQAQKVFDFVWSGWAGDGVCDPGGIYWMQQTATVTNHDRNTVSTAPTAELGARLYLITGQTSYRDRALKTYDWVRAYLGDSHGLYWDHVSSDCTIQATQWSYNQGTMIGAGVLLYQATGNLDYLTQAESTASAALALYGFDPSTGSFESGSAISAQGPAFNAIFFRNLLLLSTVDTANTSYRQAAQAWADLVWNNTSIRKTNKNGTLFYFKGSYVDLLDQAAMVELYAYLSWDPSKLSQVV